MSFISFLANLIVAGSGYFSRRRFERSSQRVELTQESLLEDILRKNQDTVYGKTHTFGSINSAREYIQKVPLVDYEDLAPYVEEMKGGAKNVLTAEDVTIFEPTSGSASSSKYIPYTRSLLSQFQEAIGSWLYDIYSHRAGLLWGPAYWCITPLVSSERITTGGIPVGFRDDGDYLGALRKRALLAVLVMPREISLVKSRRSFQYLSLLFLISRKDLALLSLWSPTFILSLLKPFEEYRSQIAQDLQEGTITPPEAVDEGVFHSLQKQFSRNPQRAREVRDCPSPASLWPNLRFISSWASATASEYIEDVQALFPSVEIQPKGLLSTEGFVSFPLTRVKEGSVLAVNSHFFDFIDAQTGNGPFLASELEKGRVYTVNITTGGGLYRYKTHDCVKILGFYNEVPVIDFVGRDNAIADWFGEKLNPLFVEKAVAGLPQSDSFIFRILALEKNATPCYCLWVEFQCMKTTKELAELAHLLEDKLMENHHYRGCRMLSQLGPVKVIAVKAGSGMNVYVERLLSEGMREGDIKPQILDAVRVNWSQHFQIQ